MTNKELYEEGKKRIGGDEADSEAMLLFEYALSTDRNILFLHPDNEVPFQKCEKFFGLTDKRIKGEPVQYITGSAFFYGNEFEVNKDVLIPRFDTEVLVENVLKKIGDRKSLIDICTGSGCIAVTIKLNKKDVSVSASDISPLALNVAKRNAIKYNSDIEFIESDMFENIDKTYDVLVSNPPYIETKVCESLDEKVKDFEPRLALDGGEDGLDFYRILAKEGKKHLNKNGLIMLEIGYDQGESTYNLFKENGYEDIEIIKDLSGNDRVLSAVFGG